MAYYWNIPLIPPYASFTQYTPVIPKLYWNVYSSEQRVKEICDWLSKLIQYCDFQATTVNAIKEALDDIQDGKLDEYIVTVIDEWFEEHEPEMMEDIDALELAVQTLNESLSPILTWYNDELPTMKQNIDDIEDALPATYFTSENTVKDAIDEVNQNIDEVNQNIETINESIEELTQSTNDNKFVDVAEKFGFWRNTYFQNYFANDLPANEYSTMQSIVDCGNTLVFTQGPASYWGNTVYEFNISNTVRVSEINKDSGIVTRTQVASGFYHSNSMVYDSTRNVFYNVEMYELTADGTVWKNTIGIIDYETLQKITDFAPVSDATYFDGIGYDEESDTIALFSFNKFSNEFYMYTVDAETKTLKDTVRLTEFEKLYSQISNQYSSRTPGNVFQSAKYTKNYILVACFHPSMIVVAKHDGSIIKKIAIADSEISTFEFEDFTFNEETGECFIQTHKRYYNRTTSGTNQGEVHEDIENIYKCNLYENATPSPLYGDATGWNIFYVDPSTTNTIQNGTQEYPFKSIMEGLNLVDTEIFSPRFYLIGSGNIPWVRIVDQHMNIVKTSASNVTMGCIYARDCDVYLEGIVFEEVTDYLHHRYDSNGDIVFMNGTHTVINGGSLPAGSNDYIVVNRSIMQCESSSIANDSNVAFRFTNASIGAISSAVASKCTTSTTCLINQTI